MNWWALINWAWQERGMRGPLPVSALMWLRQRIGHLSLNSTPDTVTQQTQVTDAKGLIIVSVCAGRVTLNREQGFWKHVVLCSPNCAEFLAERRTKHGTSYCYDSDSERTWNWPRTNAFHDKKHHYKATYFNLSICSPPKGSMLNSSNTLASVA